MVKSSATFFIASFSLYINFVHTFEQVLQNEFNQLRKKRESSNFDSGIEKMKNKSFGQSFGQSFFTAASDASYDESTGSISGVSAISGASKLAPLERDNKKLRKQKILFENRVSSFIFCYLSDDAYQISITFFFSAVKIDIIFANSTVRNSTNSSRADVQK
jgi:hypothetical protein